MSLYLESVNAKTPFLESSNNCSKEITFIIILTCYQYKNKGMFQLIGKELKYMLN